MKEYLAYIRVSKKPREGDAATSVPFQARVIEEYAAKKKIKVIKGYVEEHSAAKAGKRVSFYQMIEHLKQPGVAGVIFHKLDRSSRNLTDFALLDKLMMEGKDIRIIDGEFDTTTAAGRLGFRLMCNMAVHYSENLSEEVTAKMGECLRRGYYLAPSPVGYREGIKEQDDDPKRKYPDQNLAPFIEEAFELYATGNFSLRTLTVYMREKGMTNSRGGFLKKGSLERMLRNPFYYGVFQWRSRKTGEMKLYNGNHEPIISKELFDRVQEVLDDKRQQGETVRNHTYARLIRCQCDGLLVSGLHKGRVYLECKKTSCEFTSITEDRLEDRLIALLASFQLEDGFSRYVNEAGKRLAKKKGTAGKKKLAALKKQLDRLETQQGRINDCLLEGSLSSEEAIAKKNELAVRRAELQEAITKLGDSDAKTKAIRLADLMAELRNLADGYRDLNPITKRELLGKMFVNRRIEAGKLLAKAREPYEHLKKAQELYRALVNLRPEAKEPLGKALLASAEGEKAVHDLDGGPNEAAIESLARCLEAEAESLLLSVTPQDDLSYSDRSMNCATHI